MKNIKAAVSGIFEGIKTVVSGVFQTIVGIFTLNLDTIKGWRAERHNRDYSDN